GGTASTVARGIATGIVLTLPNPAALAAWVAVAAALWPAASTAAATTLAIGVGIGSAGWFIGLAALAGRMPHDHRALRVIPRVALAVFVGIAVAGVVRVL
nr:LysE family transporter [Myxococcota bacterium]